MMAADFLTEINQQENDTAVSPSRHPIRIQEIAP
jgi:hypothetical protein